MNRAVLRIDKMVGGGRALARREGETWMVAGALPGETVLVEETARRAGVVEGGVVEVLDDAHPARIDAVCGQGMWCGGCDWSHVEPSAGSRLKRQVAAEAARAHPQLADRLRASAVMPSPLAYRARARLHWDPEARALGFFRRRTWSVARADTCVTLSERLRAALPALEAALAGRCPASVDLEWLEDLDGLRCVAALRPGRDPGRVAPGWVPPQAELSGLVSGFHSLGRAGWIESGWGETEVVMKLPRALSVPIGAFFQVNRHLVGWLFDRVAELSGPQPDPAWDLHAGVGFLAAAAEHATSRQLVLVEAHRPAALAAARNLPQARVLACTAEAFFARQRELPGQALVIADPPRAGLSGAQRRALAVWRPQRLLMLSCDPATWARDAAFLTARGYGLQSLELADLFPATHHVEILSLLESG